MKNTFKAFINGELKALSVDLLYLIGDISGKDVIYDEESKIGEVGSIVIDSLFGDATRFRFWYWDKENIMVEIAVRNE